MERCPECRRDGVLGVAHRIVFPGDCRSDEIALEILVCTCGFKAVAVAEQLRRASLKGGAPDRVGYRMSAAAVDLLAYLIAGCPEPSEEYCRCRAHATLDRRDLRNQWNLLHSFAPFTGFAVAASLPRAGKFAYAPVAWTRDGAGLRARIDGRDWRLEPLAADDHHELTIDGALGLELDALPPFWRVGDSG